ncbi:MAG TPA: 5-deoxy-glucuronate isomerase [Streptosporangiaceae bacterium]|nr:5-deoxy-glucuronate isomerase [Streptosporangiaceae bacterium]
MTEPLSPSGQYYLPAGSSPAARFELEVTPASAGWAYSSLRVLSLAPGERLSFETGPEEMIVLPLSGGCTVTAGGAGLELAGRSNVFSQVSDFAYVPRDAAVTIESAAGGRFALPGALASRRLPVRYGAADDVPVELRGAGQASRQVNNFCRPDAFECDKLVAVEVLTPAGNWSSYPPHKHDEPRSGEAVLEEIYYFEIAEAQRGGGMAYQRVYSSGPDRQIDVLAEVRSGDVVLVPYGYHGPSMSAPGHHLYYLNVLAGPADERSMAFCDDPAHAWIRGTWDSELVDPRLPLTAASQSAGGQA